MTRHLDHALERSLAALTIGALRVREERAARRSKNELREIERQFQVPIGGEAGPEITAQGQRLNFDTPFLFAPGNRDSDFDVPQVKFSAVLDADVHVTGHVAGWVRDQQRGVVIGADVRVAVSAPGRGETVPFGGVAHFTFQGYGAVDEDESED